MVLPAAFTPVPPLLRELQPLYLGEGDGDEIDNFLNAVFDQCHMEYVMVFGIRSAPRSLSSQKFLRGETVIAEKCDSGIRQSMDDILEMSKDMSRRRQTAVLFTVLDDNYQILSNIFLCPL